MIKYEMELKNQQQIQIAMNQQRAWEIERRTPRYNNDPAPPSDSVHHVWKKPDAGLLKYNIDVTIFDSENKYGISMCIRDENNSFVEGKTMWFEGTPEPQEAEVMRLWQTLN